MKKSYAYIDGSFNPRTNVYGYGGYLIDQFGKRHTLKGWGNNKSIAKLRNVAGELMGAKAAVALACQLDMSSLLLFFDYAGIENWITGKWKTKNTYTTDYANYIRSMCKKYGLNLMFMKVKAHKGIKGNEVADKIARKAVGLA